MLSCSTISSILFVVVVSLLCTMDLQNAFKTWMCKASTNEVTEYNPDISSRIQELEYKVNKLEKQRRETDACMNDLENEIQVLKKQSIQFNEFTSSHEENVPRVAACPNGWQRHDQSCYLFSHDREDWPGAFQMCNIMGGHLAEIDTADENNFLLQQTKPAGHHFWIGLSDVSEEGSWIWMTSMTSAKEQFINWEPGEPTAFGGYHEPENCANFYFMNGKWNDTPCSGLNYYICEKNGARLSQKSTPELLGRRQPFTIENYDNTNDSADYRILTVHETVTTYRTDVDPFGNEGLCRNSLLSTTT